MTNQVLEKSSEETKYEKKWYIIHTYSGYEKKVATDLEKRVASLNLTDRVFRILPRKLFPSYVMVEMLSVREENELGLGYRVDSEAWYVIRNTNGVTGFVGIGSDPIPLSDEEADNLLSMIGISDDSKPKKFNIELEVGDHVIIKNESFLNQEAEISEIDYEHGRVKVMLEFFGRLTPVELEYHEVSKQKNS